MTHLHSPLAFNALLDLRLSSEEWFPNDQTC